jgi:large subunit ribosomal protein L28
MPVTCSITKSRSIKGHNVSKSNAKTKKIFHVNVRPVRFFSTILGADIIMKMTTRGMRTIVKYGGIDAFLLNYKHSKLTDPIKVIKKRVLGAMKKKGLEGKTSQEVQVITASQPIYSNGKK